MKFLRAVGWSRWAVEAARLVSAGNSSRQRPPGLLSAGLGRPVPFAEPVAGALVAASRQASSRPAAALRKAGRQAREPRLRMPRQRSSLGHFLVGIGVHLPMIACRFPSLPALFRPIALAESGRMPTREMGNTDFCRIAATSDSSGFNGRGGARTRTEIPLHGILSPVRLPISPLGRVPWDGSREAGTVANGGRNGCVVLVSGAAAS